LFKNSVIVLLAIIASIVSTAVDAKTRHVRQQAIISCDDRGCSDRPASYEMTPSYGARSESRSAKIRRATARAHQRVQAQPTITCDNRGCSDYATASRVAQSDVARVDYSVAGSEMARATRTRTLVADGNSEVIGGRPAGCPHAFCGCEASRYLFGQIRPELNLAANWIRYFPRTMPAPGMAAARGGHVMVLISQVDGSDWLVHDGNSGGGLTRQHVRSINGYVIVDPHGSRSAMR